MTFPVGMTVEDWESGGFESYEWIMGGDVPWIISETSPYEGNYSARSGDVNDSQSSEIWITLEVTAAGDISFYRRVSSEAGYDYLEFYIDNIKQGSWAGDIPWEEVSYPVTEGMHTFMWKYVKDVYVSSGSDCAWIDYIIFPPIASENMGVVKGSVTDYSTGLAIDGVSIGGVVTTDEEGFYLLNLMAGEYEICAAHENYDTLCLETIITENDTTILNFEMLPATGVNEPIPDNIEVSVFPNPFNDIVNFRVELENSSFVTLDIVDFTGHKIITLIENELLQGVYSYNWNVSDERGIRVSKGVYFYRIIINEKIITGKLIYL
jgi:hypothetical protein